MPYASLRDFIARLEASRRLVRVSEPVSPVLEMTEIQTRLLAEGGPAVLFENVFGSPNGKNGGKYSMPVLVNLFGTVERVAWGMDREPHQLREIGETLAFLKQPEPPGGWREALEMLPLLKTAMAMRPRTVGGARPHRHRGLQERQHLQRLAPAARRLGLLEEGKGLADLAQLVRLAVHAPGDPLDGAEQID